MKNTLIYYQEPSPDKPVFEVLIRLPSEKEITRRNFNPKDKYELYDVLYYITKAWVDDRTALYIKMSELEKRVKCLEK